MNKYYADREIIYPFRIIHRLDYEKKDIERNDFLNELFQSLLLEIDGRMTGATLLSEMAIGDVVESDLVEDEDWNFYQSILLEMDSNKLVVDENVLLIAKKRFDAFKTFHDIIMKAYQENKVDLTVGDD